MKKTYKRYLNSILCIALIATAISTANANNVDIGNKQSNRQGIDSNILIAYGYSNIEYDYDSVNFRFYKLGTYSNGEYHLYNWVEDYGLTGSDIEGDNRREALKLKREFKADDIDEDYKARIRDGEAELSNIPDGVYLVAGDEHLEKDGKYYYKHTPVPFIVTLDSEYDFNMLIKSDIDRVDDSDKSESDSDGSSSSNSKPNKDNGSSGNSNQNPVNPNTGSGHIPDTGLNRLGAPFSGITGLSLLLLGIYTRRKQ